MRTNFCCTRNKRLHRQTVKFGGGAADGEARFIGTGEATAHALRCHPPGVTGTRGSTAVADGIWATGEIPRATAYEDTGGPFFLDAAGRRPDPLADDQALVVDLGRSVVVLLGCAHSGVVNTLDYIARQTADKPLRAILGGMHLGAANEERMERTMDRLRRAGAELLMPMHCTGWPATARLWQAFPTNFRFGGVGIALEFTED